MFKDDDYDKDLKRADSPLCLFYFSHPFAIVSHVPGSRSTRNTLEDHAKTETTVNLDAGIKIRKCRKTRTANGNRRRFSKKTSAWTLVKYLTESVRLRTRGNKLPCLQDVLNTLQAAWLQDNSFTKCFSNCDQEHFEYYPSMANNLEMCKEKLSSGFPSPVLLRRRLSAPEIIMRKHMLSQQRSDSTESDSTQLSSVTNFRFNNNSFWSRTSTTGSDSNLSFKKQYKRDPDLMRKSTLLRRMWSKEFTGSINRLYNEDSMRKNVLGMKSQPRSPARSIRSSPEHISKERIEKFSPEKTKINADVINANTLMKTKLDTAPEINSCSSYVSDVISRMSSNSESVKSILETSSTDIKVSSVDTTVSTENDSFSSSKTTETSGSHLDDNSESAYTNSQTYSTFSSSKSNSENNNIDYNVDFSENEVKQTQNVNEENQGQFKNHSFNTQALPDLNSNCKTQCGKSNDYKRSNQGSEVNDAVPKIDDQSGELNIVNLNASTLNIIINTTPEVTKTCESIAQLSDQKSVNGREQHSSKKKQESFYLTRKDDPANAEQNRLIKYMISKIGTGSLYSKTSDTPQLIVPRYSALPRSASMEVNASSADSTDKESDTASLVDSLDDPNSPRQSALTPRIKYDDKPVRGDLSALLPNNSSGNKDTPRTKVQKGSAFFVPIMQNESLETKKTVAEHLPEKVRNKLSKRQKIIEQKKIHTRNKIDNHNIDSNGNQSERNVSESIPEIWINNGTVKKIKKETKTKTTLHPTLYKVSSSSNLSDLTLHSNANVKIKRNIKQNKRKYTKTSESSESNSNTITLRHSVWNQNVQMKSLAVPEIKNESTRKFTTTPNCSNRIEILEIMECVEPLDKSTFNQSRNNVRSKIPIPVQGKVQDVAHKQMEVQTIYHAYDLSRPAEYSPKTDQLIANILIDSLNKADLHQSKNIQSQSIEDSISINIDQPIQHYYHQKFEIIPEEKLSSMGSSCEDAIIAIVEDTPLNLVIKEEVKSIEVQTDINQEVMQSPQNKKKCLVDASSQTEVSLEEISNHIPNAFKGKATLAMMKDDDFSAIPKGWITFYMLHNNSELPEKIIDEASNLESKTNNVEEKLEGSEARQLKPVLIKHKVVNKENITEFLPQENSETSRINNNLPKEADSKRSYSLERLNESFIVSNKEHYSSSESSKSNSPNNEQSVDSRSTCPLPVAVSSRQSKRHSYRKGRYKSSTHNQNANPSQIPGGWSVTVSGTNACGQPAPDLEMRLKFPCPQPQSQSDSGLGEEHPRPPRRHFEQEQKDDFHLPPTKPIQTKKYTVYTKKHNTDDVADEKFNNRSFQYLPDLIKSKEQLTAKRRECSVPVSRNRGPQLRPRQRSVVGLGLDVGTKMPPLKMRGVPLSGVQKPRQTLTSYRRFSLHHSSHLSPHFRTLLPSALSNENICAADLLQLPECFPAILAVNGSAISPENKPRVAAMSDKDLTRNHFSFGQHHAL